MLTNFNPAKHLYGRGWLGLIPLVGGVVGIGLILLGIFKYKDKKLILIGLMALSFTVATYGALYYFGEYSETGRKGVAAVSLLWLNDLVKDLEVYKLKHGEYPDSLEQLRNKDELIPIYDPLHKSKVDNVARKFIYKKINSKYLLYSCGIDQIPHTKDDIFPTITLTDTSKFGLIFKE